MSKDRCYDIEDIKEKFKDSDIELLSTEYVSGRSPLLWRCREGHEFERNLEATNQVFNKTPKNLCRKCNLQSRGSERPLKILKGLKEVKCLNISEYKTFDSRMILKCNTCAHVQENRYEDIYQRIFDKEKICKNCRRDDKLKENEVHRIENCKEKLKAKGFEYIGHYIEEDKNKSLILKIKCSCGHEFTKKHKKLDELKFCPSCRPKSMIEEEARQVLQFIFGINFASIRPHFMRNTKTGLPLELDCYSEVPLRLSSGEFKHICVEINGGQHYKFVKQMHKTLENFKTQQKRDRLKRKLCKEKNIILIEIKADYRTLYNLDHLIDKLVLSLSLNGVEIPQVDFKNFRLSHRFDKKSIHKLKNSLYTKNCTFIDREGKLIKAKCGRGHEFSFHVNDINDIHNKCKECVSLRGNERRLENKKKTFDKVTKKIEAQSGKLLTLFEDFAKQDSQRYVLEVNCKIHNYTWNILKSNLDHGKWCRKCGHDASSKKQKENYKNGKLYGLIPNGSNKKEKKGF